METKEKDLKKFANLLN